jgi:hypothetical protein
LAAYSRFIAAVMNPSRVTGDLLAGMWQVLSQGFGAVPRSLLWDHESGIRQRGRLAHGVAGFCGVLGTRLIQARPYAPVTKGVVERANGYHGSSFLPGRTFASPAAPTTGTTVTTRLGGDYDVSIGANAYSVQPEAIGRMMTVTASLDRVVARCADRVVADHERLWGTAGLVSDPDHVRAASILRQQYLHRRTGTNDPVGSRSRSPISVPMTRYSGPGRLPDGHHQTHARVVDGSG